MYVDEVGNPDLGNSDNPNHRFLSLTGVIISLEYVKDVLYPEKVAIYGHYRLPGQEKAQGYLHCLAL